MPIFVSHAVPDGPWAQWIALELRAAGHEVNLDPAGADFASRIAVALSGSDPVVVLLSAEHRGTESDWAGLSCPAPPGRLILVGLDATGAPPPLSAMTCHSLHGLDEEDALDLLLGLVGGPRLHPNE
ncbi:toll/interleukin-1 receptor domain-containing protein [Actinoplanes sp. GCM10030250]|uniref:toll/interleukin-1 receptor domain-containing protein n=1 Tax=Actinoplanes sp. GCM10030250 TaxID=3273376 RepID=UPI003614FDF6